MRLFFTLLFIVLFTPLLMQAQTLEKVSLQLQWKHQFEYAGFYAAIEKGYYKDEGLELELKEMQSKMDPVQEVLDGKSNFGITYSSLIIDYMNKKPVVMLANIFKHSALVLISQKEFDLPSDLIGKKVMGNKTELNNSGLAMMFNRFNMSLDDIIMVQPSYSIDDFKDKKIDAMTAFITNQPFLLNARDIKYTIHNPMNYGSQFYDVNLFTSADELKKNPKRVEAFRRASIKGWEYALQHSDEIVELILKKYNTQHKSKDALKYEAEITRNLILPNIYEVGSINCKIIQEMADNFIRLGISAQNNNLDFKDFLTHHTCDAEKPQYFTDLQKQYLNEKKEIKVCVDPNWMPFEEIKEGKHVGMSADYMKLIESRIGIPIHLVPTKNWNESLEYAKMRKCDILSLAMETPQRKEYMNFTKPYFTIPLVVATTTDKFFITDLQEIADKRLGLVKGYAFTELLKLQYPSIDFVEVPSIEQGLQEVANENIYGFIDNLTTIGYQMQKNYLGTLKITGRINQNWELGIGVRNDDPMLLAILNRAIDTIDEKSKQTVLNQWTSIQVENGFNYKLFWQVVGFVLLLLMFLLFRYKIINRYNTDMKKYIDIIDKHVLISSSDTQGNITNLSEALCNLTGYTKKELIGKNHSIFKHKVTPKKLIKDLWQTIESGKSWQGEFKNKKKDGSFYWVNLIITPVFSKNGIIEGYNAIGQDITDKKKAQELSVTDQLTQLSNRLYLEDAFDKEIQRAVRYKKIFSVIILDIDFFKLVNDTYGHDIGDMVLVDLAMILKKSVRDTDIVGRWGGEEFLIICPEANILQAQVIAEKLRRTIEDFDFKNIGHQTCSFGVSEYIIAEKSKEAVLKRADNALYKAKECGRNRVILSD